MRAVTRGRDGGVGAGDAAASARASSSPPSPPRPSSSGACPRLQDRWRRGAGARPGAPRDGATSLAARGRARPPPLWGRGDGEAPSKSKSSPSRGA